jgi:hypothetical protein
MHYENTVRRQTIHLDVVLPLCCFLLASEKETKIVKEEKKVKRLHERDEKKLNLRRHK